MKLPESGRRTPPTLTTRQVEVSAGTLLLRPWWGGERERAALIRAFADDDYRRWNTLNAPTADEEGVRHFLERVDEGWATGSRAAWAVSDQADATVLGGLELGFDVRKGTGRVAYWTMPGARGRGVATSALRAATRWAFSELRLRRVELGHACGNEPSCRVALRVGFLPEGTLRQAMIGADGRTTHDVHLHARLATDRPPGQ